MQSFTHSMDSKKVIGGHAACQAIHNKTIGQRHANRSYQDLGSFRKPKDLELIDVSKEFSSCAAIQNNTPGMDPQSLKVCLGVGT